MKEEEKKKGQFVTKTGSINNKKDDGRLPEADAMFQSLFNFSPDAIIVVNNKGRILQANAQAGKIFRYAEKELIGKPVEILIPLRFRERHNEKMNEYLKNPRIRLMGADLELYALRKDGTEFPVDIALGYIETKDGIIVLSVVRDITEHEKMDTEIRLLLTLTQGINESKDLNSAMEIALKKVCEATGWNYGEAWVPIQNGKAHVCSPVWYSTDDRLSKFRKLSEKCVFYPGTGLPGRVWLSKKTEWIPDVSDLPETIFPRVKAARELGLKAGLGVPIICDNNVLAVLVFLMFKSREKDSQMVEIVSAVAAQLGAVISRKNAEEQARAASSYARGLIEASIDPLVTISHEGKITDVNNASELVTGVPREKLIGSDFSDYFTEPDKAREGYRQVFEKGTVRDYPLAIRHTSGKVTDVLYNATVYRNKVGEVEGVFAAARDITELKRVEQQLRAASLYTRSLIKASLDPLVTISHEGKITDVNNASELVTGVPREELIGSDFSDYFTEPDKAREGYRQVFEKGTVRDYPLAIRHISGKVTDVLYNATVYRNEAGEVEGVFAAARDITEHKKMEEAIRISEAKYRSIFENAAEGIFQSTKNARILSANPACVKILGYSSAEELIAGVTDIRKLYVEPGRRLHLFRLIQADGEVSDFEAEIFRKDGSRIWVSINAHAMRDTKGDIVGLEGMVIEITNRKRAEKNFQMLIDGAPDAILAIEKNFNILLINTHTEKLFGYSKLELIGNSYDVLIPQRYREKHNAYCKNYFANPSTKIMALHLGTVAKRRDGSEFPVEINMSPIETDEGIIIVIDIRDISEKKK